MNTELYYDKDQAQRMMEAFAMSQAIEFARWVEANTYHFTNDSYCVFGDDRAYNVESLFELYKVFIGIQNK